MGESIMERDGQAEFHPVHTRNLKIGNYKGSNGIPTLRTFKPEWADKSRVDTFYHV